MKGHFSHRKGSVHVLTCGTARELSWLLVGSVTARSEGGGNGVGLQVVGREPGTGRLRDVGTALPMIGTLALAWHPHLPVVYAVEHHQDGACVSVRVSMDQDPDAVRLEQTSTAATRGADPCHLQVDPSGAYLIAANYSSGSLAVFRLTPSATIGELTDLVTLSGHGLDPERQDGRHPHQVLFHHGDEVLVTDLGTDSILRFTLDRETGRLNREAVTRMASGAGPRHLVADTAGSLYVVNELDSTLTYLAAARDGSWETRASIALGSAKRPQTRNYPSTAVLSASGRHAYVANRGADSISVVATATGSAGPPSVQAETATGGKWPQDLVRSGRQLFVADQLSDRVTAFDTDAASELLTGPVASVQVGSPTCLALAPPSLLGR